MSRPLSARLETVLERLEGPLRGHGSPDGGGRPGVAGRLHRPLFAHLPAGGIVEACGATGTGAQSTFAAGAVLAVQRQGECVAWVEAAPGAVFAPDLAEWGIDLDALPFVRPAPGRGRAWAAPLLRAAEILLRSGAFGLVVTDLRRPGGDRCAPVVAPAAAARLFALARKHASRVLLLTDKAADAPSLGPVVGLRILPRRLRHAPGVFAVESSIVRNKIGLPRNAPAAFCRGPWGCF